MILMALAQSVISAPCKSNAISLDPGLFMAEIKSTVHDLLKINFTNAKGDYVS